MEIGVSHVGRRQLKGVPNDDGPPGSPAGRRRALVDQVVAWGVNDDEPVLSPSSLIVTSRCLEM